MRTKKRILSLLLCGALLFSGLPATAFAENGNGSGVNSLGGVSGNTIPAGEESEKCVCETLCGKDNVNPDCPVCGIDGADLSLCEGGELGTATPSDAERLSVEDVQAMIDALPTAEELSAMDEAQQREVYDKVQAAYDAYNALTDERKAGITGAEIFDSLFQFFNGLTNALEDSGFVVEGGESGTDYTLENNTLTVNTSTPLTISTTGDEAITGQIVIADDISANLTFDGVNLSGVDSTEGNSSNDVSPESAIELSDKSSLTLTLAEGSENTLHGGDGDTDDGAPGIHVPKEAMLTVLCGAANDSGNHICDSTTGNCGTLTITGGSSSTGDGGVGIGGGPAKEVNESYVGQPCGTVIILGGVMTITGGSSYTGSDVRDIGGSNGSSGGKGGDCGTVIILTSVTSSGGTLDIGGGRVGEFSESTAGKDGAGIKPGAVDNTYDIYGELTLPGDLTIPEGVTVAIPSDAQLTVPEETTLTNNGTITVDEGGNLIGGTNIDGSGVLDYGYSDGTFTYAINCDATDTVTITGFKAGIGEDAKKDVVIPATIERSTGNGETRDAKENYTVTAIGANAFAGADPDTGANTTLTSVTLPESLTKIGKEAFAYCTGLSSITIPNSVTTIGRSAFGYSGLESVAVPAGVQVWESAFRDCDALKNVTISAGIEVIPTGAFWGCTGLTGISIPASVTEIGTAAFYDCLNLQTVSFATDGSLTSIGDNAFDSCGLTSITIPSSVTEIGTYVFYKCGDLQEVTFAAGSQLETIGSSTFKDCTSLKSITIPASVTTIESGVNVTTGQTFGAFQGCTNLKNVTFAKNSGIQTIAAATFDGCNSNLTLYHYDNDVVAKFAKDRNLQTKNLAPTQSPSPHTITVTVRDNVGGTASASPTSAAQGETITLTASPAEGYHFKGWQATPDRVVITNQNSETATFTMPDEAVGITAVFEKDNTGGDSGSDSGSGGNTGGTDKPNKPGDSGSGGGATSPGDETSSTGEAGAAQQAKKLTAPKKVTVSPSYNKVKVSWKKVKEATGYQVYRSAKKNGKYKKVKTTKARTWTNKRLKTGKTYYYKVRAYKKQKRKTIYSRFSARKKAKIRPAAPALKVRASKGAITAKWSSVAGSTRYQLYRASKRNGKYYRWRETVKRGYVDRKKLRKGTTCYYKARAYRVVGGKKIYGKFSEVRKVRAK